MNVDKFSHDLLLLMLNLSQIKDNERIVSMFLEALNGENIGVSLKFSKIIDDKTSFFEPIKTIRSYFGNIIIEVVQKNRSPEILGLLRNSIKILAIILEKLKDEKELEDIINKRNNELIEKEMTYHELLDFAPDAFFHGDKNGDFINVNNKAITISEFSREELIKMKMKDLFPETVLNSSPLRYDLLDKGEVITVERELQTKTGKIITIEMNSKKNPDGTYQSFMRDITERKKIENELMNVNTMLECSFEQTQIPMALVSMPDQILRIANTACAKFLQIDDETSYVGRHLLKMNQTWKEYDIDGNLVDVKDLPLAKAMQGITSINKEYIIERKDGSRRWEMVSGSPIYSPSGDLIGAYIIFLDITELKNAELKIKESLVEKEVLLKELYHRTKNNMQVISSFLSLETINYKDDKLDSIVQNINSRIQAMSLVHQKLYQSKNLSRVNIKEYIEELVPLIMRAHNYSREQIKVNYEMDDIGLLIDTAIPLGLVINEILSNSFKHAFPDKNNGTIKFILKKENVNQVTLSISDDGVGLPDGFNIKESKSLGFVIIVNIIENQLLGSFSNENNNGLTYHIRFNDNLYKERI